MLKIIIIIIGYTPNNFITYTVDDGKMYIFNFKIKKWIHFLKKIFFLLSTMNLTLGYGTIVPNWIQ